MQPHYSTHPVRPVSVGPLATVGSISAGSHRRVPGQSMGLRYACGQTTTRNNSNAKERTENIYGGGGGEGDIPVGGFFFAKSLHVRSKKGDGGKRLRRKKRLGLTNFLLTFNCSIKNEGKRAWVVPVSLPS